MFRGWTRKPGVRRSVIVAAAVVVFACSAVEVRADLLKAHDAKAAAAAFKAMDKGDWKKVRRHEKRLKDPLAVKLVRWHRFTRPEPRAGFEDLAAFVEATEGWPRYDLLRRRAEEAMTLDMDPNRVLDWFIAHEPVSSDGKLRLGEALLKIGEKERGRAILREAWITGTFGKRQEKNFYRRHRKLLTYGDNLARMDRVLWEGHKWSARRMFYRIKGTERLIAEARWMLRHRTGNVDKAIARIPKEARNDPGLVFERIQWRRKKGRTEDALKLLLSWEGSLVRPDKWWDERAILARRALAKGYVTDAYKAVSEHGLKKGTADFAEAEWLAGWIKLRFLQDAGEALQHFQRMYQSVRFPISRARGAYWSGRAAETLGEKDWAYLWYRSAGHHPTTYYGQLALARLEPGQALKLPPEPQPGPLEARAFVNDEVVRAARLLAEVGEKERLRPFIREIATHFDSPGWKVLSAKLARRLGRVDLAIDVAKRAGLDGRVYAQAGYPAPDLPRVAVRKKSKGAKVEEPLVLALIRQESLFDAKAKSGAGARGLMQLMPATANRMAKRLGIGYSKSSLTKNPAYNVTLGHAYLGEMLAEFDGSYVLALAAYNAGPSRARAWIKSNGDPRDPEVEAIDWVEMIPFTETRNYVQRVLENLQVYRGRLSDTEVAVALERDLRRKEAR